MKFLLEKPFPIMFICFLIIIMCMGVLLACVSVHPLCGLCPQRSEKIVELPGTGITYGNEPPYRCWELNLFDLEE